jgi:hypothetical protein
MKYGCLGFSSIPYLWIYELNKAILFRQRMRIGIGLHLTLYKSLPLRSLLVYCWHCSNFEQYHGSLAAVSLYKPTWICSYWWLVFISSFRGQEVIFFSIVPWESRCKLITIKYTNILHKISRKTMKRKYVLLRTAIEMPGAIVRQR